MTSNPKKKETSLTKEEQAPVSEETPNVAPPEAGTAVVTSLEPRRKPAGKPKVRQNLKKQKIGQGTRVTKPTFGNVTSTYN